MFRADMTAEAARKQFAVLPVIEALGCLPVCRLVSDKAGGCHSRHEPAGPLHEPARGRVLSARGNGALSAPLPMSKVTRALRRV
jgi:hypothetical protein